jgi:MFS family permease
LTAPTPAHLRALTLGLVLTVSAAAFEALAVATILPETVRDIGGLGYYGWAFTGFMLANLAGIPLAGGAADRRGPALPFVAGVLLFCAGLIVAGLARSMPVLVAGRVLQGGGAAALSSISYVAVARAYPKEAQPRMMALLSSAWVVPGLFGPALAAAVARHFGWRAVFLGLCPPTLVAGGLALAGLRRLGPPPAAAPALRARGATPAADAALLAGGVALAIASLGALGAPGALRGGALAGATVLGLGGAALALRSLMRLLPAGTLRARPGLPAAVAVLALVNFAFFAVEAFLPLGLTALRGASTGLVAAALTAGTLAWTAGSWLQARLGRLPRRRLVRGGLALMLAGLAGASAVLLPAVPPALAVLAWTLAGLGMGLAYPAATLAVLSEAEPGKEGQASATMQIASALAVAVGTGVGGDLLAHGAVAGRPPAWGLALVDAAALAATLLAVAAAGGVTGGGASVPADPGPSA